MKSVISNKNKIIFLPKSIALFFKKNIIITLSTDTNCVSYMIIIYNTRINN